SRSRQTGGAGLGLAIVKNVIEAHGGAIRAAAAPAGGLWIHIELPK
ncbi:ATP-binding protein, partial [uncultured Thiodictyon sp.]